MPNLATSVKSTIAQNIANHAVLQGYTVIFTTAEHMLNELAVVDGESYRMKEAKDLKGNAIK